jgi:penicillin-binding protein 1A
LTLFAAVLLAAYAVYLIQRLDVSRDTLLARARSVEANIVPNQVAGPDGRYFDAALEIPLSLPPERIPDFVTAAFITQEDQQFRWHPGINPLMFARAVHSYGERLMGRPAPLVGGSTITMQLVKNLLLNQSRTVDRKLREVVLAMVVDWMLSKDEILAMYLNTAYFGDGAYGIEVAARKFFGRSVGYGPKIDALEAAMLARAVQRPSRLNPSSDRKLLERKARQLIATMEEHGYDVPAGRNRARGERDWRLSPQLFRDVSMRFMMPAAIRGREDALVTGLTIDTEAQLYAELAATDLLKQGKPAGYDSSAILVLQPDGAVVALATGHDYDGVDLVRDGRVSPGSTLKPFMTLCALEHGLRPDGLVPDRKHEFRPGWTVRNFDGKYLGDISLDLALQKSRNTSAVELFDRFGHGCFADVLARFGIKLDNPKTPTSVLGSEHVSLLDLAAAYATLANGGAKVQPYAVRYAREKAGPILYRHVAAASTAPPAVAGRPYCELLGMLRNVTRAGGTGHKAAFSHPVYGKTGTSQGYRDALFAGFTGHYVAVVWLGRQARGDVSGRVTGGELPAEVFRWLMATLHEGKEPISLFCEEPVRVAARTSS